MCMEQFKAEQFGSNQMIYTAPTLVDERQKDMKIKFQINSNQIQMPTTTNLRPKSIRLVQECAMCMEQFKAEQFGSNQMIYRTSLGRMKTKTSRNVLVYRLRGVCSRPAAAAALCAAPRARPRRRPLAETWCKWDNTLSFRAQTQQKGPLQNTRTVHTTQYDQSQVCFSFWLSVLAFALASAAAASAEAARAETTDEPMN